MKSISMVTIYQLKIELTGSYPEIWRRIQVASDLSFSDLHDIIRICMGWESDQFEFIINETRVRDFGIVIDTGNNPYDTDAMDTLIDELVTTVGTSFAYICNFENRWEHRITVEKEISSDKRPWHPVCIGGERACPPENCGGISRYQDMLNTLVDAEHKDDKKQMGKPADAVFFNKEEVNTKLKYYAEAWEDIYEETGEIPSDPEDSEYERHRHLTSPRDMLEDELQKAEMAYWIENDLKDKNSAEYKTFMRLVDQGYNEGKSRDMILNALSIEWFYDLKYGIDHLDERYGYNLDRLPEEPQEIPSLDFAAQVLDNCIKGIPFAAIEYLHNDPSQEAASTVIKALRNFSDHRYCWADCFSTPIWYSLAAEGHLCEELIDLVIAFYDRDNINQSDWLFEQGEYLIGKLAQKYPDLTTQKVLAATEKDADEGTDNHIYFLFDVFHFCDIDKYKDRLISLLKRDDISCHESLASTIACLQIKEGLPVLREQQKRLKAKMLENIEIDEAIVQLEKGEILYPEVNTPLCLRRNKTWREEFAHAEKRFYDTEDIEEDFLGLDDFDSDPPIALQRNYFQQPVIKEKEPGRNDPCPCGSGKKYKKCCLDKDH